MSGISQIEAVKTAQEIYKLLTDFNVLYDVWIVETKTFFALRSPRKASKLVECFSEFETVFDALYCALEAIGAGDILKEYQSGRKRVGDIRERMAR
jgi:hypothetical protein